MTPPSNSQRRRETDRQAELRARENVEAIIYVLAQYADCSRAEVLEWFQGELRTFKRKKRHQDFAWQAFIWVSIAGIIGLIGTAITIIWQSLIKP